jgi:hypothetical protein
MINIRRVRKTSVYLLVYMGYQFLKGYMQVTSGYWGQNVCQCNLNAY